MIGRHTGLSLSSHQVKQLNQNELARYFDSAVTLFAAQQTQQLMQQLNTQIEAIEGFVLARCQDSEHYALITTTPGIGKILGMTILLETGPIERFAKAGNYASYARCVPTDKISNGKSKGKGNAKNGNRYLAMAFVEAAHYAAICTIMHTIMDTHKNTIMNTIMDTHKLNKHNYETQLWTPIN